MVRTIVSLFLLVIPANASFVVLIPSTPPAYPGSTVNSFDVVLFNSWEAPNGPFNVDSYNVQISIPGGSGLTITGVTTSTVNPYLFDGNSFGLLPVISGDGTQVDWSDLSAFTPAVVSPGQSYGLGHVLYDVDLNALYSPVMITLNGITTIVEYPSFTPIPYSGNNGILAITSPAPPSAVLFLLPVLVGLKFFKKYARYHRLSE